ncbi:MAG: hypothetical protein ATN33_07055 [Epulopiscium sp. Nele67-Bin001]|nr:MAG: hypothetical protein BEN18_06260 [Epulopiscium sp. Nuni2H_MBin001]OON92580.1 MAG: hypothetical protein ATN33_07055 [Epulopiscium sp. Nele67-Bin001]
MLKQNTTILFQGDSITDCHRNRMDYDDLGNGYVNLINYYIQKHMADDNIKCINRGIAGDRTADLQKRWKRSTLCLDIDILSLLVGVNDTWRRYDLGIEVPVNTFKEHYHYLLDSALEKNPALKIILMSPFLLPTEPKQLEWHEDLEPKIEVVKQLALQYNAVYIPLQEIFNNEITAEKPNCYWTYDGVHPTPKGHVLIAKSWIDAL